MAQSLRKMEQTLDTVLRSIHNPTLASMSSGMVTRSPSPSTEGGFPRQHTLPPIHTLGYHPAGSVEISGSERASQGSGSQASREAFQALMARGASLGADVSGRAGSEDASGRPGLLPMPNSFTSNKSGFAPPPPLSLRHSSAGVSSHSQSASPLPPHHRTRHLSPRLHSLPDNSLNPLGLLAEASLHTHKRAEARGLTDRSGLLVRNLLNNGVGGTPPGKTPDAVDGGKGKGKAGEKLEEGDDAKAMDEDAGDEELEEEPMGVAASGYFRPGESMRLLSIFVVPSASSDRSYSFQQLLRTHDRSYRFSFSPLLPSVHPSGLSFLPQMLPLRRIIIEHSIRPEILDFLTIDEVQELFDIYFDCINPQIPILDRAFHTPALVASRSPFLLTTICSTASKFYQKRPELWAKLNTYVRKLAFDTPR